MPYVHRCETQYVVSVELVCAMKGERAQPGHVFKLVRTATMSNDGLDKWFARATVFCSKYARICHLKSISGQGGYTYNARI